MDLKLRSIKPEIKTLCDEIYKEDKPHSTFYVDIFDQRFWIFHTLSKSERTDQFMSKFVFSVSNNIDFPWFDTYFLETLVKDEIIRGFTLKFEEKIVNEEEIPIKSLSMKLWGKRRQEFLKL